jgi:phosphate transport system permease protein
MKSEKIMKAVFATSAGAAILSLILICIFLFTNGLPAIFEIGPAEFLGGKDWSPSDEPPSLGILPMIIGSLYVTLGAVLIGAPVGIFTAVFMAYYCPKALYAILKPATDLLAGIPSIVYGFFGMMLLVPFIRENFGGTGSSILAASVILGMMILPTIIGISEAAIRSVPKACYENALALGASHERSIFYAVLPAAKNGVIAAVVLGVGRAVGETMAVIMVAGNQARIPNDILQGVRTLTANIVLEMGYAADLHREALFATALVLLLFIFVINIILHRVTA